MKKIMIHINSMGKGGAERVVSLLCAKFTEDGYEVVLATEWVAKEEYPLPSAVKRLHVGLTEAEEESGRLTKQYKRISRLRKAILEEKPAVVLAFCVKANYRALLAGQGTGVPVVACVRNDPKVDYVGRINAVANKLLMNRAAGCVFQTEEARDFFDPVLQKKSVIIWNPVNEKYLQACAAAVPAKRVVTVGRLNRQKNQKLLVQAFARFAEKFPDYRLDIYGDDSGDGSREAIEACIREMGLEAAVRLCGTSSTLEKDLADAAMFVLSSDYEGMPNALMEAMALGLPVISTDCPCGGSRFWIKPEQTGLLTPVGDERELAAAMERLAADGNLRLSLGRQAREALQQARLDSVYLRWKTWLECDIIK